MVRLKFFLEFVSAPINGRIYYVLIFDRRLTLIFLIFNDCQKPRSTTCLCALISYSTPHPISWLLRFMGTWRRRFFFQSVSPSVGIPSSDLRHRVASCCSVYETMKKYGGLGDLWRISVLLRFGRYCGFYVQGNAEIVATSDFIFAAPSNIRSKCRSMLRFHMHHLTPFDAAV